MNKFYLSIAQFTFWLAAVALGPVIAVAAVPGTLLDPRYDELEGAALVVQLLRDQQLTLAEEALKVGRGMAAEEREALAGMVRSGHLAARDQWLPAAAEVARARPILLRGPKPVMSGDELSLLEARLLEAGGEGAKAWARLSDLPATALKSEADILLAVRSGRASGQHVQVWQLLSWAASRVVSPQLAVESVLQLVHLKLERAAEKRAYRAIESGELTAAQTVGLTDRLRVLGWNEPRLIKLLTAARLLAPYAQVLDQAMIAPFHALGWRQSVFDTFSRLARMDRQFAYPAAEMARQIGRPHLAAHWAVQVADPNLRARLDLAIAVDRSQWPLVEQLSSSAQAASLLRDAEARYALAYSRARLGNLEGAQTILAELKSRPAAPAKATRLAAAIRDCVARLGSCDF